MATAHQTVTPRRALVALLAVFACLAATYSVVTPLFEASDELSHYPFVQHLASGGGLPVQDPANPGPWLQEGSQPPLYYALAALVTSWAPAGDWAELLPRNPHADIGIIRPDGNANMVIHSPREAFPWSGAALAIHLARGLSVLLSTLTVLFVYLVGREALPGRPWLALAAAAVAGFTPMFLFVSGAVSNDPLVVMLATATLWLLLRTARSPLVAWRWALAGAVIGLATLAKVSALGLLPLAALTLAWIAWRRRDWRIFFWGGACVAASWALVSGWWFIRNWRLYRDPLGWNVFVAIASPRSARPGLRQLISEWQGFVMAYWGLFGGVNVAAPQWFYRLFNGLALLGAVGLLVEGASRLWRRAWPSADTLFRLGLLAVWPLITLVALVRWTILTMASQGRLLFPAIASLSYFLVLGLAAWGRKLSHGDAEHTGRPGESHTAPRRQVLRPEGLLVGGAVALMLGLAAWAPFAVIAPAYARPRLMTEAEVAAIPQRLDLCFGDSVQLLGYKVGASEVRPGDYLPVTLYWRALAPMERNYSVFVHLVDANGAKVGQRDVYPGLGLYPTSQWRPGDTLADTYYVRVPATTFNPSHIQVVVGLYFYEDGQRLPVVDRQGAAAGDRVTFGDVLVRAGVVDGIANPLHYNLDGVVSLVGYNLDRTSAPAGGSLRLTVFWQALAPLERDYMVYARVLDGEGALWAGVALGVGRARWPVGKLVAETYDLTLRPDAPPGVYAIRVGICPADATKELQRLDRWGHASAGPIILTTIGVLPPALEKGEPQFTLPPIQHPLDARFGDVARLAGYSLPQEVWNPNAPLAVTLYWEALNGQQLATSYAVFVHVLDPAGQIVAQHDSPPALGLWPTTDWAKGQAIVDLHPLSLKDPWYRGSVRLEVGLYDPVSGQRLPCSAGGDSLVLPAELAVQPYR